MLWTQGSPAGCADKRGKIQLQPFISKGSMPECVLSRSVMSDLRDPMNCSLPGSSVQGILQARILEWVACPPPGDLPNPGTEPSPLMSFALAGGFFTTSAIWEAQRFNKKSQFWCWDLGAPKEAKNIKFLDRPWFIFLVLVLWEDNLCEPQFTHL